ncbi:MAG: hypothetical protein H0V88_08485 [Pyrinomonadaceae bacterium]|nr:hypothetical protein [Pyrinomonadaceae bacterium]
MSANVTSTNPIVQAIISGTIPQAARMAAARGMLPLAQAELLEVLVVLQASDDEDVKQAAAETLNAQEAEGLLDVAAASETSPAVLGFLAARADAGREVHEAVTLNAGTPDEAIALLARITGDGALLELITFNQQRLIRAPAIIDAVLSNAARTPEAERRVREVRREFFEKERGAQQIAGELRARGQAAAAEFIEASESIGTEALATEDAWLIASHIEVSDADIDDSWLPTELLEELYEEDFELRAANAERIINETIAETGEAIAPERVSLIRQLMMMNVKDRVKMGMKGDRETRSILIRDANRIVSSAVIHNPRITDPEIEAISAMRTVSDEVLRLIALNRQWARTYGVIHNLARNSRTPIASVLQILPRIQAKDLQALSKNRNVSEAVRRQAQRLSQVRAGH